MHDAKYTLNNHACVLLLCFPLHCMHDYQELLASIAKRISTSTNTSNTSKEPQLSLSQLASYAIAAHTANSTKITSQQFESKTSKISERTSSGARTSLPYLCIDCRSATQVILGIAYHNKCRLSHASSWTFKCHVWCACQTQRI